MVGEFWDEMYAEEAYRYGLKPNDWVVTCEAELPRNARVLCVGDGEGRNGVWLAEQGHRVTTIDASARGAEKARALAASRGVPLDARVGMFPAQLDERDFDAIVLVYVHAPPEGRPGLHGAVAERLAPGGVVVLEAFTPEQLALTSGGPKNPAMLYTAEMLAADFSRLDIASLEPRRIALDEGPGHTGPAEVVRMLARRADA
ncbi:MAG: class I SAM-dependent methyltransferase [Deltaproteobacteria bacterium]|nr:MAG: class I SAM-dependent methyltransferase [Deltaproteobacteria bacterium]